MNLTRFPRVRLTHAPTALEYLPNLSRLLGGPEIYIKRDDCTRSIQIMKESSNSPIFYDN